jgi:phage terminase large subunit
MPTTRLERSMSGAADMFTAVDGAYFAAQLAAARASGRIGPVAADPILSVRAFWDLGVSDSTAIWIAQFVGREIGCSTIARGRDSRSAIMSIGCDRTATARLCVLPHDGAQARH